MKKTILSIIMIFPCYLFAQVVTGINPNQIGQGQSLNLTITGNNIDFQGWSCTNAPSNGSAAISPITFTHTATGAQMSGTPTIATANTLQGTLQAMPFQPLGTYTLEVYDGNTCSYVTYPFGFQVISSTSIDEKNSKLLIFPNPVKNVLNIQFNNIVKQDITINIINTKGEIVFSEQSINHIGSYSKTIDLNRNLSGIYFLEIATNNGVLQQKLILQ